MATSTPPTPRRCRRILEVHHLDCQGLSADQIAERLGCGRSTVYTYLRDHQLHQEHILRTVAADRLADQVYLLTHSETESDQHRRHVAATRELRLLLQSLPAIEPQEHNQSEPDHTQTETSPWDEGGPAELDPDGHRRVISGPNAGKCSIACAGCLFKSYARPTNESDNHPDQSRITEPEPDQSSQNPDQPGQVETNLDKSGHRVEEFPVPNRKHPQHPQNSRPKPGIGPEYPNSWNNPTGYFPERRRL